MIYFCESHSDRAIEDAIEQDGHPPRMEKMENDALSTTCSYCEKKAVYKVE
ncbi:CxxH/CxxC protein [Alteribacillus bidgolensis]|uniref:CxxH/CxxC protein, BA_5709 family n=1 Tax=Alteribacillus bidgolensis TaxID=930129 RepID=A0A1G8LSS2_9BACI|nr:CxxH/CxxC protein [Alteribacillus bidgolensis]SDI58761.1 CxxH/CxxC protein, BA_5709 family [Alteribacillus bidgolensis]